jgi:hypothetical protein
VRKNKARVLVGQDAKFLDINMRLTGPGYHRLFSAVSSFRNSANHRSTDEPALATGRPGALTTELAAPARSRRASG